MVIVVLFIAMIAVSIIIILYIIGKVPAHYARSSASSVAVGLSILIVINM